jgi:hypothetical protein
MRHPLPHPRPEDHSLLQLQRHPRVVQGQDPAKVRSPHRGMGSQERQEARGWSLQRDPEAGRTPRRLRLRGRRAGRGSPRFYLWFHSDKSINIESRPTTIEDEMDERRPAVGTTIIIFSILTLILIGILVSIVVQPNLITRPVTTTITQTTTVSPQSNLTETISTTVAQNSASHGSTICVLLGQPGGLWLRIISDSTSTSIAGAEVTATNQPAFCGSAPETNQTSVMFTTNGTEWYHFNPLFNGAYSFAIKYSDEFYFFAAVLRPVSQTCVTLYVPSWRTNITITKYGMGCP